MENTYTVCDTCREGLDDCECSPANYSGVGLIAEERKRQIEKEGWLAAHDDEHANGEMAQAAACYTLGEDCVEWPWEEEWWKPKDRISDLVRAGALIAAEIDRLTRLST